MSTSLFNKQPSERSFVLFFSGFGGVVVSLAQVYAMLYIQF